MSSNLGGRRGPRFTFGDQLWIPEAGIGSSSGRLLAIGPSLEIDDAIAVDTNAYSAIPGFGSIWIAPLNEGTVLRLDATSIDQP